MMLNVVGRVRLLVAPFDSADWLAFLKERAA
jgi:hypothetical protein